MTLYRLLLLISLFPCLSFGQEGFSYISDRRFYGPESLVGYDFRPESYEIRDVQQETKFTSGTYSFGITTNNLYVAGPKIQGVYNINEINTTEYGFFVKIINARDARLQGHLKLIINSRAEVEALIFKRSPDEDEMIFYQKIIPKRVLAFEKTYFSDWGEVLVPHVDSLWGTEVRPFFRVHSGGQTIQERLHASDSTVITFVEEIFIDEKVKVKESEEEVKEMVEGEVVISDTTMVDTIVTVKETILHKMLVRSIVTYTDGTTEDVTDVFEIKRMVEREDEQAGKFDERFQIELVCPKEENVYLYLSGDRTVSSIEIGNQVYQVRGY